MSKQKEVFISTYQGYGLWYDALEIPVSGIRASGVKSISLKNDHVVSATLFDGGAEYITVITSKSTAKRVKITEFDKSSRARRGLLLVREVKTNPYYIFKTFIVPNKSSLSIKTKDDLLDFKVTEAPIMDRYSTGSAITKEAIIDVIVEPSIVTKKVLKETIEEAKEISSTVSLKEVDERIMTIDDFLDDLEDTK